MTLKMIAIGILALMGLSSIMSPKTFRRFMGGLGALCMALFVGFVATGNHSKEGPTVIRSLLTKIEKVAGLRPNWWDESATEQSQRIVNEMKNGRTGDPGIQDLLPNNSQAKPRPNPAKKFFVSQPPIPVNLNSTEEEQGTKNVEAIQERIDDYLTGYKAKHTDIGVDRLTHRNLDPKLLLWGTRNVPGGLKDAEGNTLFWLVFDENYDDHIREQGRKLVIKERLWPMAYIVGACGAFLLLGYGLLKVLNRRSEPVHDQDYLKNSNISMV